MKKYLLWLVATLTCFAAQGKEAYNISVTLNGYANETATLAYYFGDKQYVKKEATTNAQGNVVFSGDTALPAGLYIIVLKESLFFEILVEEQFFSVEATYSNDPSSIKATLIQTLSAKKSDQNSRFFNYNRFVQQKRDEADALKKLKEIYSKDPAKKADADAIDAKLTGLDKEVENNRKQLMADLKGKLLPKLLLASQRPKIPEEITDRDLRFQYYRSHFWDDFDFKSAALLYTPTYHARVIEYLENLTVQHYDSVSASADYIIQLSKNNREFFKYTVTWMLNRYATSTTVCYDAVYVSLAKKYYETGLADWAEPETLLRIKDNARRLDNILCGKKAPAITPKTETYATPSLYKVKAQYTVLLLWDVDCGRCKLEVKELKKVYADYKDSGVMIYSVDLGTDWEKWQTVSGDEDGIPWINLHKESITADLRKEYDVRTTPEIFVLDEDKKILYKRIDAKTVGQILGSLVGE